MKFLSLFFDNSHLEELSLCDLSSLQDLRDQIVIQRSDELRVSFRQSSRHSFWHDMSNDAATPPQVGEFLGGMEYEEARIVLMFLGDVFRFSLSATSSACPFCPTELNAVHLFTCPNNPFRHKLPTWDNLLTYLHLLNGNPQIQHFFLPRGFV
jgi:hypothetical protein